MIRDRFGLVSEALAAQTDWTYRRKPSGEWVLVRRPRRQEPDSLTEAVERLIEETRERSL